MSCSFENTTFCVSRDGIRVIAGEVASDALKAGGRDGKRRQGDGATCVAGMLDIARPTRRSHHAAPRCRGSLMWLRHPPLAPEHTMQKRNVLALAVVVALSSIAASAEAQGALLAFAGYQVQPGQLTLRITNGN